ncbi:MAG: SufS family cysteine desulfurase [Chlamydiia bacterium]|nr:SufS family cysteine desulfurase [Chlamydiia bacterium]
MRDNFPIFSHHPELIYLDSAATTHKPQSVIDALSRFYAEDYATVHRTAYRASLRATEQYNSAREAARRFLHAAHGEEIVFTRGTTDAINLVAASYGRMHLKEGDEILISEMEHHSNIVPWQMLAQHTGAILRIIPMDEKGVLLWEGMMSAKTCIVAIAHIANVTGTINPIAEIAKAAHAHGAVLVVDGAQGAPHAPVDVQALDCDFYAFSAHKCYGPTGIGILYGKKQLLEQMPPIQGGGDMVDQVFFEKTSYQEPPLRFEAGTPLIASAIGLKRALEWIEDIGRESISVHEGMLLQYATERLVEIPHLRILGRAPSKGPIITFHIEGVHPLDLATLLDVRHIALRSGHLCAQPLLRKFGLQTASRVSFGIYNTRDEVDQFIQVLQDVIPIVLQ